MQRTLDKRLRSDDEIIKDKGLILDFDEIARKGAMSKEESAIAKWYGIYHSRQAGNHMARVVVPGGKLTSAQAGALARLSAVYSPERLSFTTRQAAQFHCLKLKELPAFLRDLANEGLSTFHGCGDVTRNVAACSWASLCPHRRLDVLPYAQETAALLTDSRDLDNLPRKFKVTFSGCGGNCGQPFINCVGLVAVQRSANSGSVESGFHINIGGGMGWKPFAAQTLYTFVPPDLAAQVCRAVGVVFRDNGDRYIRMYARLKFVVQRLGIEQCRALVDAVLDAEGVDRSRISCEPFDEVGDSAPVRPQCVSYPVDDSGLAIERIMIPKGEISSSAFGRIAELADIYGDKHVYSSNRQNLELHGVRPEQRLAVRREISGLGFLTDGFHGLLDVVSCVGTTYCPLAVTRTHDMFDLLQEVVHHEKYVAIRDKAVINISGCPNSCAQYRIADIGMRGLRIREQQGSVEAYQITIGGEEPHFGESLGDFKVNDCVRVVCAVLDTLLEANTGETLADHVKRVGSGPYQQAVAALNIRYLMAPNPSEHSVFTGYGDTPKDLKTSARDIPCQAACPAHTNVPQYIRHIAQGDYAAAHRINQEDNVFPGVLGRVCTRPCEERCRYQWTSTRGPVRICHLKRVADDNTAPPREVLPPWFEDTGKQVAIVGAGPAGLAAARELKRYGHGVVVYDRADRPGGQMRAIPGFRLPVEAVDRDIEAIVNSGIHLALGKSLDADAIVQLRKDNDAVLLAAGTNKPVQLALPGLPEGDALDGLHFMLRYAAGAPAPIVGDVLIIGGGFTAVDCARSSRRLLGSGGHVAIMYRRGEPQMAATEEELQALRAENIQVETLVSPVSVVTENGRIRAVAFQRNLLGAPDASGKPRFIPVPDSTYEMPCDTLIIAIGQVREPGIMPEGMRVDGDGNATDMPGIFVAGDFASGSGDVIHAAADGKTAAHGIDAYLMGRRRRQTGVRIEEASLTGRTREHDFVYPPPMPVLALDQRTHSAEVEQGYGGEDADVHAWRCYLCNYKFEIDQDKCIHCDWCIRVSPRECIRRLSRLDQDEEGAFKEYTEALLPDAPEQATYIWIDSDNCIRCGNCINICPVNAISLRKAGRCNTSCK